MATTHPTHVAVIFDKGSHTFRNDLYEAYKGNRDEMPADLRPQIPLTRDATRAFNIACQEIEGYEADDIIATLACQARDLGGRVTIISSDKDLMQLVGDGVEMLDAMKNRRIDVDGVREKFGVNPAQVVDVQALAGDSVDNIPGAPGIGLKTAALLINEFGTLEDLLDRTSEIKQPKRRQTLRKSASRSRCPNARAAGLRHAARLHPRRSRGARSRPRDPAGLSSRIWSSGPCRNASPTRWMAPTRR